MSIKILETQNKLSEIYIQKTILYKLSDLYIKSSYNGIYICIVIHINTKKEKRKKGSAIKMT